MLSFPHSAWERGYLTPGMSLQFSAFHLSRAAVGLKARPTNAKSIFGDTIPSGLSRFAASR